MYVTGVGRTKFGPLRQGLTELLQEAVVNALQDAGLESREVECAYVANFCAGPFVGQLHLNALLASLLPDCHIPIVRIEAACASGGAALFQAGSVARGPVKEGRRRKKAGVGFYGLPAHPVEATRR
jgi:acetyl-CoA C-acetyltransferase